MALCFHRSNPDAGGLRAGTIARARRISCFQGFRPDEMRPFYDRSCGNLAPFISISHCVDFKEGHVFRPIHRPKRESPEKVPEGRRFQKKCTNFCAGTKGVVLRKNCDLACRARPSTEKVVATRRTRLKDSTVPVTNSRISVCLPVCLFPDARLSTPIRSREVRFHPPTVCHRWMCRQSEIR